MKIKRQHKLLEQCTNDRNHLLRIAYVSVGIWIFIILWCILTGTAYGQEESETVSKKRIYDMANIFGHRLCRPGRRSKSLIIKTNIIWILWW